MTPIVARHISVLTAVWVVLAALLAPSTAVAQESTADDDAVAEPAYYGDAELIETLRTYDLLDEWFAESPVSRQASLLQVNGGSGYQARRQTFLDAIASWANRTTRVRTDLARVDKAQADADALRAVVNQVRDALVRDDRLAVDSKTLVEIEDALAQLAAIEIPENSEGESEDPVTRAEVQLKGLQSLAETELVALNGSEPALSSSGPTAFVGQEELQLGLSDVDQLIKRGRDQIRPALEQSERLIASALGQIPDLHAARFLGSTDVDGLSVVTVDAYIRAAANSCSVDWALLAGIGRIESNHGRLGGASVSRSGQVSTQILGPLLDGGETERRASGLTEEERAAIAEVARAGRAAAVAPFQSSLWGQVHSLADSRWSELTEEGNGFAVVVDTDGGRLDGNDEWDRAVGPMQFIPETWSKWATDGNGDGVADPHNLYDAAASAGRFLCDLSATRGPSPSTFVLGYNSSTSYVRSVLATAQALRSTALPNG